MTYVMQQTVMKQKLKKIDIFKIRKLSEKKIISKRDAGNPI